MEVGEEKRRRSPGCGMVWCGVVWCGVVWCGVVCGLVDGASFGKHKVYNDAWKEKKHENTAGSACMYVCMYVDLCY